MLSLDVGRRRIGLAGCDPLGITVTPLPPLHRGRFQKDLEVLEAHLLMSTHLPLAYHGYLRYP